MTDIEKAITHFEYGISHDIFKEPVTSYAKTAIFALEKQIAKKPKPFNGYEGRCTNCNAVFLDRLTKYCGNCGQKLDWSEEE